MTGPDITNTMALHVTGQPGMNDRSLCGGHCHSFGPHELHRQTEQWLLQVKFFLEKECTQSAQKECSLFKLLSSVQIAGERRTWVMRRQRVRVLATLYHSSRMLLSICKPRSPAMSSATSPMVASTLSLAVLSSYRTTPMN